MKNPAERADDAAATIRAVSVTQDELIAEMRDGGRISAPLTRYPRLLYGTPRERGNWRLIAGGHGVHWPDLDEDLSATHLVLGQPSGENKQSLDRWIERQVEELLSE